LFRFVLLGVSFTIEVDFLKWIYMFASDTRVQRIVFRSSFASKIEYMYVSLYQTINCY
jgi:hypothetical protein